MKTILIVLNNKNNTLKTKTIELFFNDKNKFNYF